MKSLRGLLHGILYAMFHALPKFASGLPPRDGFDANTITWPLDEDRGPSHLHGPSPRLVWQVGLKMQIKLVCEDV